MINIEIKGFPLNFETSGEVFSPSGADAGTLAMLSETELMPDDVILDLGCGYGLVGIFCAKSVGAKNVYMTDILPEAAALSRRNAELNGCPDINIFDGNAYENVPDVKFTLILSNPPYHTDFSVAKAFIEGGFRRLSVGGRMIMVTKRLDWYKNKLTTVFGGVKIRERDGYYVFIAEKRALITKKPEKAKGGMSKKLRKKYGK